MRVQSGPMSKVERRAKDADRQAKSRAKKKEIKAPSNEDVQRALIEAMSHKIHGGRYESLFIKLFIAAVKDDAEWILRIRGKKDAVEAAKAIERVLRQRPNSGGWEEVKAATKQRELDDRPLSEVTPRRPRSMRRLPPSSVADD